MVEKYILYKIQLFNIDDKLFFTFGGARSHDIQDGVLEIDDPRVRIWRNDTSKTYRINHISWWEEEMPNEEEMDEGSTNLSVAGNKVDFYFDSLYGFFHTGINVRRTF